MLILWSGTLHLLSILLLCRRRRPPCPLIPTHCFRLLSARNFALLPFSSLLVANAPSAQWFEFVVEGLLPGTPYFVRVRARNIMGLGAKRLADPRSLVPRTAPLTLDLGTGVTLSTVPASRGSVSVRESIQSLLVQFRAPQSDRGSPVLD